MKNQTRIALITIFLSLLSACGQKDTTARATSQNNTNGMNTSGGGNSANCLSAPISFNFTSTALGSEAYAAGAFPSNDLYNLGQYGNLGNVQLGSASNGNFTVSKSSGAGSIRLTSLQGGSGQIALSSSLISALPQGQCANGLSFVVMGNPINYGYFYLQLTDGSWRGPIGL